MHNQPRSEEWNNFAEGNWSNLIGQCGVRPLGIGKDGKAKLAAWNTCRALKKDGNTSDSTIDTSFLDPHNNEHSTTNPPPPTDPNGGPGTASIPGLPMWGYVGIGVAGITLLSVGAYFLFHKKKA